MADRGANIDLVFRNGLKDYEVLPPPEVWETVRPVVRIHQKPVIILRAAAMVAVILSLGFLAYKWSMNISSGIVNSSYALNPESENQGLLPTINNTLRQKALTVTGKLSNNADIPAVLADNSITTFENEMPGDIINLQAEKEPETKKSGLNEKSSLRDLSINLVSKLNPGAYFQPFNSEIADKSEGNRWTIAALISPTYYSGFNMGHNALTSLLVSEEQPLFSYSGGLALSYKINKRFSVQSGLYYSSLGNELSGISSFTGFQRYDYTKGDHNFEVLTTNGTVYTDNADVFLIDNLSAARISTRYTSDVFDPAKANLAYVDNSLMQNFRYLELPIVVKYKLVDRTLGFNIIGGLSSNFLVNNSVYASLNGVKYQVGKTAGINTIAFSSSLGMGMEYSLGKNLSLNLEPTFRYYLNPFSGISGIRIHPYSFGVFSGLSFRF